MDLPLFAPLHQKTAYPPVADVYAEVKRQWLGSCLRERLKPGARVAPGA